MEPYYYNISGKNLAFDKIPKPKIINWEVAISPNGENNSISCLTMEPYYYNISG